MSAKCIHVNSVSVKASGSSIDSIPPYFLKQVFDTVNPYLVTTINRCFETSSVPEM